MSDRNRISGPERLPSPPEEYDPVFFDRLIGLLDQHLAQGNGRRKILGTTVNLSDLPTSATGLRSGDVWNDAGVLKIIT
jgi:hypothetical protein